MKICKRCIKQIRVANGDDGGFSPGLTVAGTLIGATAAVLSGGLAFIPAGALAGLLGDTIRCSVCGATEGDLYEIDDDDEGRVVFHHSYTDLQTPEVREPAPEDQVGEKHGETFAVVPQNFSNESLAPNMPGLSWSWGQGFGLEDGVGGQGASPSGMGQNLGFGNIGGGVSAEGTSRGDAGASGGGE